MPLRFIYFISFVIVSSLLLFSLYLENYAGIVPCPLCTLQRLTFCLLGIFFLLGLIWHKRFVSRMLINFSLAITSILGLILAGRQIWMQHFPINNNNDCAVGVKYLLETLPIDQVIYKIFVEGGAECSKRGWSFFHFNMAEWAFIWFILFLLTATYLFLRELRYHR